jgi:hypothetical protein
MELKAGSRLKSAVCTTEVIVVKAPGNDVEVTCGGSAMLGPEEDGSGGTPAGGADGGTQMGKRYVTEDEGLELLCTKPGDGSLGAGNTLLSLKEAKTLPASD